MRERQPEMWSSGHEGSLPISPPWVAGSVEAETVRLNGKYLARDGLCSWASAALAPVVWLVENSSSEMISPLVLAAIALLWLFKDQSHPGSYFCFFR